MLILITSDRRIISVPLTCSNAPDKDRIYGGTSLYSTTAMDRISRFLRTNQAVHPQDVEKDATQLEVHNTSSLSPSFRTSLNTTLRDVPTHQQSSTYRFLPIISGILIPFSILLSIPSLTDPWYIRTDTNNLTIESRPNSLLLDLGMGFSMACSVFANICLILRFAERKVLGMTWLCILFLTLHGESQHMAVSFIVNLLYRPYKYICGHYIWRSIPFP